MTFTILTLFPEIVEPFFRTSIMGKAVERGLIQYRVINFRDFAQDRHKTCDDAPYGGGAGMVIKPEPLAGALDSVNALDKRVIYPSPSGVPFHQATAERWATEEEIILICGRYEGIDQRIIDLYVDEEVSLGDYVLSSGELAAMVMVDAVYRLKEGIISGESLLEESFQDSLLEYPHYTRPEVFRGLRVPEVLIGGHHEKIRRWRMEKRLEKTARNRPDLLPVGGTGDGLLSEKQVESRFQEDC